MFTFKKKNAHNFFFVEKLVYLFFPAGAWKVLHKKLVCRQAAY